jgi:SAM-dependent methyltransferase
MVRVRSRGVEGDGGVHGIVPLAGQCAAAAGAAQAQAQNGPRSSPVRTQDARCASLRCSTALGARHRRTAVKPLRQAPDREASLAQYRRRAGIYDLELALFEPVRTQAAARLALRPGEVVIDVGCGTGLSLSLLEQGVGRAGRIIGIEQCPEMIEQAHERVLQGQHKNVTLLCSPVEAALIPEPADAALFHFTHDILRQPQAVANIVRHLKPGARVVASGLKWAGGWASPMNFFVWPAALHSVTTLEGLSEPWSRLADRTGPLTVETLLWGAVYLASGRAAG